ncbi:3-oxoacyl-[acyl-carrier protein] reductase [Aeromicrobium panaciterrae]|uniref:3-oxoacyl-[acyl-carrier protein] reductase n=1 Tax=Aeromicrobium panaciterrae TaxID=363861 RepID=A0ABU1UKM1_9ACTN|nr:3-oxoacyl-ACP reductase FabG [Aeromicrobium panaciterrae]MDR7085717.1 3-oxoacyl-[acyl-carrier protein] reductase [Aeromicrobium panaciterrae]
MTKSEGRVVVITGGSRGLGAGIVQAYLDEGYRVATCARTRTDEIDRWANDPATADRILFMETDLSDRIADRAFIKAVVDRWGRIDILVNNAGVARDSILATAQDDDVDIVIDLNLKGTLEITRLVSRRMLAQGSGYIINISSVVGLNGYRGLAVYSATKAALDGMTRALARELGSRGIMVNSVAPGYLRTEMSHGLDEDQLQQIIRRTPAGRLGEPEDVARIVLFLTSEDNRYVTGQVIVADGGLSA